jgi:hypothetical protein
VLDVVGVEESGEPGVDVGDDPVLADVPGPRVVGFELAAAGVLGGVGEPALVVGPGEGGVRPWMSLARVPLCRTVGEFAGSLLGRKRLLIAGMMIAAARRWVPTSTMVVAVSSGATIDGTIDRAVRVSAAARNRRRWRTTAARTTPAKVATMVQNANAVRGMALPSTSRLTSAAWADAATTTVAAAAAAPASIPVGSRLRRRRAVVVSGLVAGRSRDVVGSDIVVVLLVAGTIRAASLKRARCEGSG